MQIRAVRERTWTPGDMRQRNAMWSETEGKEWRPLYEMDETPLYTLCVWGGGCWETLDTSNDQEYSCPLTYYSTSRNSSWNKFLGVLRCSLASVFSEVWRILTGRRADCIWQLLIKYMKVTEEYTILLMITSLCVCVCVCKNGHLQNSVSSDSIFILKTVPDWKARGINEED